uniref:Metallo-beta-lactamase domain-containing protein n=1 Tax=Thermosporothrix sp. COM3 TaxID=2490863 RepID=A0A455SUP8_9CHLR|nr:hypothetical protein KTC_45460 [Thermosporothrix sp. COM3]
MKNWVCATCGAQFSESEQPPAHCPVCEDDRQYVGYNGQQWTTIEELRAKGHQNKIVEHEPGLIGIGITPTFAIGQRALLVQTPQGNVLWDCIPFIDEQTAEFIETHGGIKAIAISHPHYYTGMVDIAKRFHATIYLHEADKHWIMRSDPSITLWSGDTLKLMEGITLLRLGGHFAGGTVLHWAQGAEGKGLLLSGDIIQVVSDRRWLTFMYSYPNMIPLPASEVERMSKAVAAYPFERLYGAWFEKYVAADAYNAVQRSAERYIKALQTPLSLRPEAIEGAQQ